MPAKPSHADHIHGIVSDHCHKSLSKSSTEILYWLTHVFVCLDREHDLGWVGGPQCLQLFTASASDMFDGMW